MKLAVGLGRSQMGCRVMGNEEFEIQAMMSERLDMGRPGPEDP